MAQWRFPSNDYGENKGINDSGVAMFRGTPLKSLAREICQNSLDAAIEGMQTIVEFNLFEIDTSDIPGKDALKDAFDRSYKFWSGQKAKTTREFFAEASKKISLQKCWVLRISDFNTTGLTGSREVINTDWTNLTKSSGASDKKGTAGGSYGIGKFAPFACSEFSTVYYSTYDKNEEKASQGVARLVTFTKDDGQNTQGIGYYGNEKNTPVYDELHLEPGFARTKGEYGTDIYIAGYKYAQDSWQSQLIVSVLDDFLGAIYKGKLEVRVGGKNINKDNLGDIIDEYKDEFKGHTVRYYEVMTSKNTIWKDKDIIGDGKGFVHLGILLSDEDSPNKVSMIRQTGMRILDKDRLSVRIPFMGVMFIEGQSINEQLRAIENPEHTRWEPERAGNPVKARTIVAALYEFIKSVLEELISSGSGDEVDAAGVGNYIPDSDDENASKNKEEVVENKVVAVEVKSVKRKASGDAGAEKTEKTSGGTESGTGEGGKGGAGEGNSGNGGQKPGDKGTEPSGGSGSSEGIRSVGVAKFVCVCVNRESGNYVLKIVPDTDAPNASIELFLSAETQRYPAPLKKAKLISGNAAISGNKIHGFSFVKGNEMRFSVELDYSDYCSMEVALYAVTK